MSKIEGGKLTIAHEPFNFKISLQGVINLIQPQALERGLDFEVSLSGVDEEELLGDALRLNQILINILSNALKFTPSGALYGWRYTSSIKRTIMCSSALLSVIRALV